MLAHTQAGLLVGPCTQLLPIPEFVHSAEGEAGVHTPRVLLPPVPASHGHGYGFCHVRALHAGWSCAERKQAFWHTPPSHMPLAHWRTRVHEAPVPCAPAQWPVESQNDPNVQSRSVAHDVAHAPALQVLPLGHDTALDFVHASELPSQTRLVVPALTT